MTRNIQATDENGERVDEPVQINGSPPGTEGGVSNPMQKELDANGEDISNVGALGTDQARVGTAWSEVSPDVGAKHATTGDLELFVSTSGSDSNDGTSQSSPFRTLNKALSEVPKNIYHKTRIWLDYGDYSTDENPRVWNHFVTPRNTDGFEIVGHDSSNPFFDSNKSVSDVTLGGGLDAAVRGSDQFKIRGVRIDGRWQSFDSYIHFNNCEFTTGNGSSNQCIGGHGSKVVVDSGTFDGSGSETAVMVDLGARFTLKSCTASNIDSPARLRDGILHNVNSDSVWNNAANDMTTDRNGLVIGSPVGPRQSADGSLDFPMDTVTGKERSSGASFHKIDGPGDKVIRVRDGSENIQTQLHYSQSNDEWWFRDDSFNTMGSMGLSNGDWKTAGGTKREQRGDPTTSDLADGENMVFNSDGTGTGSAGDLVYAVNDSGTIKTAIIQQLSNAT